VHPILFRLGPIPIHAYGVAIAVGLLIGLFLLRRDARRFGLDPDAIADAATVGFIVGLAGARATYVAMNWDEFASNPIAIIAFWRGLSGFVFLGGFIPGLAVGLAAIKRRGIRPLAAADLAAPYVALVLAFGRVGCFMYGCCFGRPTDSPLGIVFPPGSPAWYAFGNTPVHPTQLYSSANALVTFAVLYGLTRRRRPEGLILGVLCLWYGVFRFLVEFLRGDNPLFRGLTPSQWVAIPLAAAGIWLIMRARRRVEAA